MRRWIGERLDDLMLPLLKMMSPGYHRRLPEFRPADACEISALRQLGAPAEVRLIDERPWLGRKVEAFAFPSPVDCQCESNRMVHGRLITADPNAPWTLIVPGYSTGATPPYNYSFFQDIQGRSLLERGMNVALIDLPFHLRRKQVGCLSGEGFFSPDLAAMQATFQQAAADSIALVRWLEQRSEQRVGLWGTSLGGCVAGLVATQVPDLSVLALMEPLDNPGHSLQVLPGSREIRERAMRAGVTPEQLPAFLNSVAPSSYRPLITKERILFVTPLWDRVVPVQFQEAFWEAWGRPERILREASHTTMAANRELNARVADFIARWTQVH